MDGAQSNRSFMNMNVGSYSTFSTMSPCSMKPMFFIMDPSYTFKTIRIYILKSGIGEKCTRLLTLPSELSIQWQLFIDCYKWDKSNALQMHRKLTNEYLYPSNQSKMRNYLAENVLDLKNLITQYRNYLGDKETSKLIDIFHDRKPITDSTDPKLLERQDIAKWFDNWKCSETPLINSDIIENTFNQQRSTYHGANTNPNSYQYRTALNNIILTQRTVSTKSNA
ncbi:hypothetical protein MAR_038221 [Mya arenaria]|uniref:Uncharacterized protein n=1 Tax=Mya arenaria TaxID=6604 RepID=A0ABY7FU29_MYAAR|nr:hypothetical protein MAR_038221 [Mya arenaria]